MKFLAYILSLTVLLLSPLTMAEPLVIGVGDSSVSHKISSRILKEVYRQLDIPVEFKQLPNQRTLVLANAGNIDGDAGRIDGIENKFTNLIRVPTPVIYFTAYAYGIDSNIHIDSWEDLQPYSIGIQYGVRYMDINTVGMDRTFFYNNDDMFRMLIEGRLDVGIGSETVMKSIIMNDYPNENINPLGKPLYQAPLFHVLNKKNKDLVSIIDAQLKKMQRTGELKALYEEAVEWVLLHP